MSDVKGTLSAGQTLQGTLADDHALNGSASAVPYIPQRLAHKLTFTGAVDAAYDGSTDVNVVLPQGGAGGAGADGFSPVATVTQTEDGAVITITDKDGTTTATITNGKDGENGQPGKDGSDGAAGSPGQPGADGNGIKAAVLNADYTLTITFDNGTSYTTPSIRGAAGKDGAAGTAGKDGSNGKDGISATHRWDGTTLTVTSASGTSSADLKGDKGDKGDSIKGDDGISPMVDVSKSGKVTTISITDKYGTKTATINDGADGSNGSNGTSVTVKSVSESTADGGSNVVTFSDGKTLTVKNGSKGSKGDAYTLTDADKNTIVNAVIAALPDASEVSY